MKLPSEPIDMGQLDPLPVVSVTTPHSSDTAPDRDSIRAANLRALHRRLQVLVPDGQEVSPILDVVGIVRYGPQETPKCLPLLDYTDNRSKIEKALKEKEIEILGATFVFHEMAIVGIINGRKFYVRAGLEESVQVKRR
jgi:hypothetical protein